MGDFMNKFLLAAILTLPLATRAQTSGRIVEGNIFPGIGVTKNYIINPSAHKNAVQGITASTVAVARNTTTPIFDGADFLMTTSGAGTAYWSLLTLDTGLNQQNCEFSGTYELGGGSWTADIRVGANVVSSIPLPAVTAATRFTLNYPCTGVTSVGFRTTASAPQLDVDDLYFGLARNIGSVAQATFVGGMEQVGAAGCQYQQSTSTGYTDYVALGTGTGCNAWTVTSNGPGTISAQGTNDHRLVYTNMPAGNYQIVLTGSFAAFFPSGTPYCSWSLFDGTTRYQTQFSGDSVAGNPTTPMLSFNVSYTTAATRTFTIQASDTSTGACSWDNAVTGVSRNSWRIHRFPSASEQVFRPDQVAWRVDANIAGANANLGTAAVSSYTGITNPSLTLTNNTGAGVIAAQIPCSGTNAPTGTTCSAGDESIGVSFNLPVAGDVLACASFAHEISLGAGGQLAAWFQLVETPNNAQTILQEGKARIQSYHNVPNQAMSQPHRLCGTFNFTSAGQKTLRLMYEQGAIVGTVIASLIQADANASFGQRDIKWEVYPLNFYQPAPLLIGSVVSNSSGIERTERVRIGGAATAGIDCTASPCNSSDQSGAWVTSVTRGGTGSYLVNIAPGIFSAPPTCQCTSWDNGIGPGNCGLFVTSALQIDMRTSTNTGTFADTETWLTCQGPR